jgi:hypothetical protein
VLFETDDLDSGHWMPADRLPPRFRHGSIIPITAAERTRLLTGLPPAIPAVAPARTEAV